MTTLASIIAALTLLVAPVSGSPSTAQVTTNLPGATAPAAPTVAPTPEQEAQEAAKAVAALKAFAADELAKFQQAAGAPSELAGVSVSRQSGFALITFSCPSKGVSLTIIAGADDTGWKPMDMFIPIPLKIFGGDGKK